MSSVQGSETQDSKPSFVSSQVTEAPVVVVEWEDLLRSHPPSKLSDSIEQALGPQGTGLIAIRNVPGFVEAKRAFLPQAHHLVHLPTEYLETTLTDAASLYNAGWSHGKEKLKDEEPDWAKGSFYYNPVTDCPGTPQDREMYPHSYPCNKWPDRLPNFQSAAVALGKILQEAVVVLTKHVDALATTKVDTYEKDFLYNALKDTEKVKARLLYYFPLPQNSNHSATEDSWIGWHNDSGFLTALAGDIYVDHTTGEIVDCPDPKAGLYVVNRNQQVLHVTLPFDCMAVQIGECTQIVTGGAVVATPHCVRGIVVDTTPTTGDPPSPVVARISLACFVDTPPEFRLVMPASGSRDQVVQSVPRVPPLQLRWDAGMTFGDFLKRTFALYYQWSDDSSIPEAS